MIYSNHLTMRYATIYHKSIRLWQHAKRCTLKMELSSSWSIKLLSLMWSWFRITVYSLKWYNTYTYKGVLWCLSFMQSSHLRSLSSHLNLTFWSPLLLCLLLWFSKFFISSHFKPEILILSRWQEHLPLYIIWILNNDIACVLSSAVSRVGWIYLQKIQKISTFPFRLDKSFQSP